jgi:DNA repair exonuclease SbcCD ATPase subunit
MNDHQIYAAVSVLLVLAMALWLSLRALRRAEQLERQVAQLETGLAAAREALERSDAAAGEAGAEAERRQAEIESRLAGIEEQQHQLRLVHEGSGSYGQAIRLAQQGASAEELATDCGLNRGEAELLVSLHGPPGRQ